MSLSQMLCFWGLASVMKQDPRTDGRTHMPGKFEVYRYKAGKLRWRLKAGNREIVATGEAYDSKAGAKSGCQLVQRAADGATIVDVD